MNWSKSGMTLKKKLKLSWKGGMSLVLAASFALITACGTQAPAESNSTAAASGGTDTQAKAPVEIEFWYGLGGNLGDNMKKKIDAFNASQNEVVVKGIVQADYTETEQKLQAAIASKKVPAAVLSANIDWARKGYYASMDEMIAADPEFKKTILFKRSWNKGM